MKEELPQQLGEMARQYFYDSFDKQGFGDDAWEEREHDYDWPILVKSGQLKSDVGSAQIDASWEDIRITINNDYAAYQNYGTSKLPARTFAGMNDELKQMLSDKIAEKVKEVFE